MGHALVNFDRVFGDTNPLDWALTDDGGPVNLTSTTPNIYFYRNGTKISITGSVVGAATDGNVRFDLTSEAANLIEGIWDYELELVGATSSYTHSRGRMIMLPSVAEL